jgi:hypothetical protein
MTSTHQSRQRFLVFVTFWPPHQPVQCGAGGFCPRFAVDAGGSSQSRTNCFILAGLHPRQKPLRSPQASSVTNQASAPRPSGSGAVVVQAKLELGVGNDDALGHALKKAAAAS